MKIDVVWKGGGHKESLFSRQDCQHLQLMINKRRPEAIKPLQVQYNHRGHTKPQITVEYSAGGSIEVVGGR